MMKHYLITVKEIIHTSDYIYEGETKKLVGTEQQYSDVILDTDLDENFQPIDYEEDDFSDGESHSRKVIRFKLITMGEFEKTKNLIKAYEAL